MKLHLHKEVFDELSTIVSKIKGISESAVKRDYYIVFMLQKLEQSPFSDKCVFKGGTSLSKCYPSSIERFSEDIDLTYLGMDESDKTCDKKLKQIESIMSEGANIQKIVEERNDRNKSSFIWFDDGINKVKLEIGCTVRPDPYSKKEIKTYIQEFLENKKLYDDIEKYELKTISLNVLGIERTFIDKVMTVKRHALCGSLSKKVRHIYDVVRLFELEEIQKFLNNKEELKRIIKLTKETDAFYIGKRNVSKEYNPLLHFDFNSWKNCFDENIKKIYEKLHEELLFTDKKQDFNKAIDVFNKISGIFYEIGE